MIFLKTSDCQQCSSNNYRKRLGGKFARLLSVRDGLLAAAQWLKVLLLSGSIVLSLHVRPTERPNPQSHQRSSMEILQQASYRAVQSMRVGSHILTLNPRRRPPRAHQPPHRPSFLGFWSQKGHAKPGRLEHVALFLTAFTMTFDAGYLNAVCLAGIFRVTVSHTTGTITKIGERLLPGPCQRHFAPLHPNE